MREPVRLRPLRLLAAGLFAVSLAAALAGCADDDRQVAQERAERLVELTRSNGTAPELTVEVARNLYGEHAYAVCASLAGSPLDLAVWARVTRAVPEELVQDLVAYDRSVVEVYCPDRLDDYEDLLDTLNVDESDR
ncbi:hypothetical protein [Nocardioides houyundeii]|uniref:hypothetical protein n=1 Tax=Nocardioides houyundeii TaxID=2045452 RepID=UPI000C787178|nr:hypothetical protein [Nocardioides houyundeii]